MYCIQCGNMINQGEQFCTRCGNPIQSQVNPISNNQCVNKYPIEKKNPFKIALMIIGGIVLGLIVLGIILFVIVSFTSKKLVCKSPEGDITLMYNDKTITGYTAFNVNYDLNGQQKVAEEFGIERYLNEFEAWFKENTTGSCER